MKDTTTIARLLACGALAAMLLAGCASSTKATTSATASPPMAVPGATSAATVPPAVPNVVQTNPPGDIPDTQLFVTYRSANGYSVLFPEGWSRASSGSTVTFRSNYDGEQITTRSKSDPNTTVRALFPSASGMKVTHVTVHGSPATLVSFRSRSNPNAVTGRSVTLENQSFVFLHGTHEAVLSLWAPQGSDNVDQWRKISQSFHWK